MLEIIVKVGRKSDIIFNNAVVKPIRAITIEEVRSIIKNNTAIQYVILEKVEEREYDQVKQVIGEFKGRVLFYVTDSEDEETNGLADELSMDVYTTIDKLHSAIERQSGIVVANTLRKIEDNGDVFDTSFYGEVEEPETVEIEEVQEPETEEIWDMDVEGDIDTEIEDEVEIEPEEVVEVVPEEVVEVVEVVVEDDLVNHGILQEEPKVVYVENEEKILEYTKRIEELESERDGLIAIRAGIEEERDTVREELKKAVTEVQEFKDKGEKHTDKLDWYEERLLGLNEELEKKNTKLKELSEERDRLALDFESASKEIKELSCKLVDSEESIIKLNEKIGELKEKIEEGIVNFDGMHSNYTKEKELRSRFEKELSQIKEQRDLELVEMESIREKVKDLEVRLGSVAKPLNDEIVSLRESLEDTETKYSDMQSRYNALVLRLGGNEAGATKVLARIGELETGYIEGLSRIGELEKQIQAYKAQERILKEDNDMVRRRSSLMEEALQKQLEASSSGEMLMLRPIRYVGKAKIIPVYGTGSYGVTTTAVSTAFSLSADSKVVLVDFDLDNPKVDAKLSINPASDIDGSRAGYKNTALTILVEKGIDTFKNYYAQIRKPASRERYKIDYVSGVYTTIPTVRFIGTDFNEFINFLGRQYDYIIMDFGKIGDSARKMGVLNTFARLSYKSIVVTPKNKIEIRNLMRLITNHTIPGEKGFLLNMAESTKGEDDGKLIGKVTGIVPYINGFYGTDKDFFTNTEESGIIAHEKFELFLNTLLGR